MQILSTDCAIFTEFIIPSPFPSFQNSFLYCLFPIIYDDFIKTSDHKIKTGLSYTYIDMSQSTSDTLSSNRIENIPGAFFEYTYTGPRLTTVLGARYDYHLLYGQQFVPRVHLKYKISEYTDFRLTTGKGWRVPNYIMDNVSLLANSFAWIAPSEITPEISKPRC